jgi:hypothetical protein
MLGHVVPDRDLEKVLHECVRRTLEQLQPFARGGRPTADKSQPPLPGAQRLARREGLRAHAAQKS